MINVENDAGIGKNEKRQQVSAEQKQQARLIVHKANLTKI
jgi:hypothetical protein